MSGPLADAHLRRPCACSSRPPPGSNRRPWPPRCRRSRCASGCRSSSPSRAGKSPMLCAREQCISCMQLVEGGGARACATAGRQECLPPRRAFVPLPRTRQPPSRARPPSHILHPLNPHTRDRRCPAGRAYHSAWRRRRSRTGLMTCAAGLAAGSSTGADAGVAPSVPVLCVPLSSGFCGELLHQATHKTC